MTRIKIALLAVFLVACQDGADPQVAALVGTERINKEVTLTHIVAQQVSAAMEGEYEILVTNQSQDRHTFPVDFGVQLLIYSDNAGMWREVENFITYLPPDGSIVLGPRRDWPDNEDLFSVRPVFEQTSDDTMLRIIVVGQDERGEGVAAYIDIPLGE